MRSRTLRFSLFFTLLFAQVVPPLAESRQATVTESKQAFRTYPFSDPDPVARMGNIYPYFRFEGYSLHPVDREWKIVTLENPYIKVLIAPEIGGKVLGAFEKSSGKAFIYYNRVVKFREIAMRGPWTSGGIEFNFGDIGHAPTTATPVDYLIRTNKDSSVSCIVGALDLPSRTEWRVEIRLPKDKAYFETRSMWFNPTELNTSLYCWMNAAADADADLRFIFPGRAYIGHGGDAYPWPHDESGRDLSAYSINAFGSSKSYHVLGSYTNIYGAYWAKDDFGVVHWSRFGDKLGKKIWIWAASREGEIWKDLLTDPELGNGQYVEIQSGLLFNQAGGGSSRTPFKHMFFEPLSVERFDEAWFPFLKIGDIVEANLSGSLSVKREGGSLRIGFCPLEAMMEEIEVKVGGRSMFKGALSLNPLQSYMRLIPGVEHGEIEVTIGRRISYRSSDDEVKRLHRPLVANKEFDWNSVAGLYTDGAERAKQRDYKGALEKYLACLSKDPVYSPALVGAAEVLHRRTEFEKALTYARRALANDAYDPDANFIYGIINRQLGHLYDAKDGFGVAARSAKYRAAANIELGEIALVEKKYDDAIEYAGRAYENNMLNVQAWSLLAVTDRLLRHGASEEPWLDGLLQIDPLNHFARFERYLLKPTDENLENFKSSIRNELPHETYLELASYYLRLGLLEDALGVLKQAPPHPIVLYWLAYLSEKRNQPESAQQYLQGALRASPHLVFPFRAETAEALHWAALKEPSWKTNYYLGLFYWSRDRVDSARAYFAKCGNEPDYAPFYLARGRMLGGDRVLRDYQRALELGQDEWRTYHTLLEYYNDKGEQARALGLARAELAAFPSSYVSQLDLARALLFNRQFAPSAAILDTITILPFEGARYGREVYRQAFVLLAAEMMKAQRYLDATRYLENARRWPERLGVGKPYEVDNCLEDYLEGLCRRRSGEETGARELFKHVAEYTLRHPNDWGATRLFEALSLRELGRSGEANAVIEKWTKRDPRNLTARWSALAFAGRRQATQKLEEEIRKGFRGSLLSRSSIDPNLALLLEVARMVEL
jgi:tetratricopeptide (TPR) repeat protein